MAKSGPRTTCKYSDEFKATAVRLSELPDVAIQDVAASLYIHPFMLARWRKQVREGEIVAKGVAIDKETAAELKALRRMKRTTKGRSGGQVLNFEPWGAQGKACRPVAEWDKRGPGSVRRVT